MADLPSQPSLMRLLLGRAIEGDPAAMDDLLRRSCDRLTILTRHMLGEFKRVKRWADTGDVLQNALVRLMSALRDVKPASPRDFLALATLQIRRELIDLARRYYGPMGIGANHDSRIDDQDRGRVRTEPADLSHEPASLAQWTDLHRQIEALPEEEREVVDLLFYQGLPQAEAAELLNLSLRTLQRRWHDALAKLHQVWNRE